MRALRAGRRRGRAPRSWRAPRAARTCSASTWAARAPTSRRSSAARPQTTTESEVAGVPLRLPMVDVHTVSAGGGSIAWADAGGALRVGPRSAGAEPGPAAYGRGGEEPTVTDADLFLGHLADGARLGGEVDARPRPRRGGARARSGERLGLDALETARGIVRVADAEMVRALRVISVAARAGPEGLRARRLRRRRRDARVRAGRGARDANGARAARGWRAQRAGARDLRPAPRLRRAAAGGRRRPRGVARACEELERRARERSRRPRAAGAVPTCATAGRPSS